MSEIKNIVTKEMQVNELLKRVTPIVNIGVIVQQKGKYLIGHRNPTHLDDPGDFWIFPGGRVRYDETLQEAAIRKLKEELPGVEATIKKLVTVISDKGYDHRANGVTVYYLFDYLSGEPKVNTQLDRFNWQSIDELEKNEKLFPLEKAISSEIQLALKYINSNSDELIVEVDKEDNVIGKIEKYKAHSDNRVFHRSALIIVYNTKGEVVLHQRSFLKSSGAGQWDVFGGHNNYGMTIEQTAQSELYEELGIDTPIEFLFKVFYQDNKQSEFMYIYKSISDGPYAFDKNEVEQVSNFDVEKLLKGEYDKEFDILEHVKDLIKKEKEMKTVI
jgi:isopentenyl-diphosphate delta-isomerase